MTTSRALERLVRLLDGRAVVQQRQPLYRAFWAPAFVAPNGHWFSLEPGRAAEYIEMHRGVAAASGWRPFLAKCIPASPLRLLELPGNHVLQFAQAFDGHWNDAMLVQALPAAFELLALGPLDGIFRPKAEGRSEVFLTDPGGRLLQQPMASADPRQSE